MSSRISFECPECSKKLSVADRSKLGKKIKCPNCQEVFTPDVPEEEADNFDAFEDLEDESGEEQDEALRKQAGGRGKGGGKKGGKKGESSGGSQKMTLMIGGGVALVVLIGAGIAFSGLMGGKPEGSGPIAPADVAQSNPDGAAPAQPAQTTTAAAPSGPAVAKVASTAPPAVATQASPAEKMLGLRWMPADTEMVVHAKISEIWKAPLLKGLLEDPSLNETLKMLQEKTGLTPADIDSISTGSSNVTEGLSMGFSMGMGGGAQQPLPTPPEQRQIFILKTKKPVDWKKVSTEYPGVVAKKSKGKTYYEAPDLPLIPPEAGWWSPDSKTLIIATKKELFASLERGESVIPRKEFASLNHLPQLVIASIVPSLEANSKLAAFESIPAFTQIRDMMKPFAVQLASVSLSVKGGFDLQLMTLSGTDDGSKKLKTEVENQLKNLRTMFDSYKQTAPPLIAELGEMLWKNLKTEEKSRVVKVSTSIPDSAQAKLEQLPPIVMMMAMTGGFGGAHADPRIVTNNMGGAKQPGETYGVKPATIEGLPEGMQISAKTAWSAVPFISADGNLSTSLEILVDVTGPDVEKICGSAGMTAQTMKLNDGGTLKATEHQGLMNAGPEFGFRAFNPADDSMFEHPPQTLRMRISVEPPTTDAKKLDVLEGSFKMLTAESSRAHTIEQAPKTAKRPLKEEEFKVANLKLRTSHSLVRPAWLSLSCDKNFFLSNFKGIPGNPMAMTETTNDQTTHRLYASQEDGQFPDDFQVSFTLHSNTKESLISFRFENVPLPTADSKPAMPGNITFDPQLGGPGNLPPGAQSKPPEASTPQPNGLKFGRRRRKDDDD